MISLIEVSNAADSLVARGNESSQRIENLIGLLNDEQRVALSQAWTLTKSLAGDAPEASERSESAGTETAEGVLANLSPLLAYVEQGDESTGAVQFIDNEVGAVFHSIIRHTSRFATGGLGPKLVRRSLVPTAISALEQLIGSMIDHVLTARPEILSDSDYSFNLKELESYGSIQEARTALRRRRVRSLLNGGIEGWQKFFARRDVGVDAVKLVDNWALVREFYARRNLLTHENGVVDSRYISVAGDALSQMPQIGDRVFVGPHYLKQRIDATTGFGCALTYHIWMKLHPSELDVGQRYMIDLQEEMIENQLWISAVDIRETIPDSKFVSRELLAKSSIHRWTALKFGDFSTAEMRREVCAWDISGLDERISHAKHLLLDEMDRAKAILDRLYRNGQLSIVGLAANPLYRDYDVPVETRPTNR